MENSETKTSAARAKIVSTALRLFNEQGVHHTGNEQIISESGVAKMTFYNHFPTKSKLIAEYLRLRDARWFKLINEFTNDPKISGSDRVLAIFDALGDWFKEPDFYGCPFIRGLSDFDSEDDPEVTSCVENHFGQTGELIQKLLTEANVKNPEKLVPPLLSLVAGAIVVSHATKSSAAAQVNRETAKILIDLAKGK
jgi:AcrR family transcriptional regulator